MSIWARNYDGDLLEETLCRRLGKETQTFCFLRHVVDPDRLLVNIVTDVVIVVDGFKWSDSASTYSSLVLMVLTS